jgi:glucosamine--fructose-6-phosphate aminotransferase (isomerizing)
LTSRMLEEALEAPAAVARQLATHPAEVTAVARALADPEGRGVLTLARGSSDHAAQHLAYLAMARLGRLVTSLPLSLITLYGSRIGGPGLLSLAFSQSGQSPDLVEPTQALARRGAITVAIVNDTAAPLAAAARHVLPLHAGPERSVAATKSYIAQLVAGARLVAQAAEDDMLRAALQDLPGVLERAAAVRWPQAEALLAGASQLFVLGRGPGLAIAQEAALKFKEVCGLQAEAFSGAEVQHGPMALVGEGWPVLVLAPRGPAQRGLVEVAQRLAARGAKVMVAAAAGTPGLDGLLHLPLTPSGHEDLDAIAAVQTFYPMVEALARLRDRDPDAPPHLAKVTRTH